MNIEKLTDPYINAWKWIIRDTNLKDPEYYIPIRNWLQKNIDHKYWSRSQVEIYFKRKIDLFYFMIVWDQ